MKIFTILYLIVMLIASQNSGYTWKVEKVKGGYSFTLPQGNLFYKGNNIIDGIDYLLNTYDTLINKEKRDNIVLQGRGMIFRFHVEGYIEVSILTIYPMMGNGEYQREDIHRLYIKDLTDLRNKINETL